MKAEEFFKSFSFKGCDGIVIVNSLDEPFTHGNTIDVIYGESFYECVHTLKDFKNIYGADREILEFGASDWNGFGRVYIKMRLQGVASNYDVYRGCFIVTVDDRKYVSHLHDDEWWGDDFELIENI